MEQVQQDKPQLSGMQSALMQRALQHDSEADAMTNPLPVETVQDQGAAVMVDDETELRGMLELGGAVVGVYYRHTGAALTKNAPVLAQAIAPVMQKYGWSMQGRFGVELTALAVSIPVGLELAGAISMDKYEKAAAAAAAEQAAADGEKQPITAS
jgi:hypothetical protein